MNVIDVFEYDFVNDRADNKYGCNDFKEAKKKAYEIAKQFCEDEEPRFVKESDNIWSYRTNCDFGSIIFVKEV